MTWIKLVAELVWPMWQLALSIGLGAELWTRIREDAPRAAKLTHACGRIHQELWIVAPPGILFSLTDAWAARQYWAVFCYSLSVANWWWYRNWPDDDNRWNRRRKKLTEAVAVRGHRLVVAPQ